MITLGIIGVVAAMTMPPIITNINDRENIVKWKKSYSLISNVFNKIVADGISVCKSYNKYGHCDSGAIQNEDGSIVSKDEEDIYQYLSSLFFDEMKKNLKVIDACYLYVEPKCDNYANVKPERIKYKWAGIANIYSRYNALGDNAKTGKVNSYNFSNRAYLLADGTAVYFGGLWNGPWIVVDVNNYTKGPNQFGKDVFVIKLQSDLKKGNWLKPLGAAGTFGADDPSMGSSGCDPKIGKVTSDTVYEVAGAGCSAKYLLE